jgi:[ribosomal protein S5]-alanine N-acetyltransferase
LAKILNLFSLKSGINEKIRFSDITTQHLSLSKIESKDIYQIVDLYNNYLAIRFTDNERLYCLKDAETLIKKIEKGLCNSELIYWGIRLTNGKLVGTIGLYNIDWKHRFATAGNILQPQFWNKGIMTEAQAAIVKFGFLTLKLNRIEAQIFSKNYASCKVFEKLGFTCEGRLRQNFLIENIFEDSFLYSILQSEFENIKFSSKYYKSCVSI